MSKIDTSPSAIRALVSNEDLTASIWQGMAESTLLALADEKERAGWQPIETAPKDGTWILCCCDANNYYMVLRWGDEYECYEDLNLWAYDATYWMPLPERPNI